jgi:uncharacterized LabA/DUF88 family protein
MGFGTLGAVGRGNVAPQPIRYLFVDGGFVESIVRDAAKFYDLPLTMEDVDFEILAHGFQRTFYYDALPVPKPDQDVDAYNLILSRKQQLFSRVNATPYMHTREGITRNRLTNKMRQQKGVDILLAIDVFKHASLQNMSEAHVMTKDLDFFPLFEALRDTPVSVHLHCACDETSEELMSLADVVRPVTPFTVLEWIRRSRPTEFVEQSGNVPPDFHAWLPVKEGLLQQIPFKIFKNPINQPPYFIAQWTTANWRASRYEYIVAEMEHKHQRRIRWQV